MNSLNIALRHLSPREHVVNHLTIGSVEMYLVQYEPMKGKLILKNGEFDIPNCSLFNINTKPYLERNTIADIECPTHYEMDFPLIDFVFINRLSFIQGNFIKYLLRAGKKDDFIKDIDKCISYLQMIINSNEFHNLVLPGEVFSNVNNINGFKREALILFDKAFSDSTRFDLEESKSILRVIISLLEEQIKTN